MRFFSLDVLYAPRLPDLYFWWKLCVLYSRFYGKSEVPDTGVCETDDNSMQAAEVTSVSSCAPAQPSVQYKVRKAYSCDICPYSATNFAAVLGHKKLHVKRPGYSYDCSVCPSHSKLRMNRETGCGCHTRLLCFYVCVCVCVY